jgi:hypothetical protein
VGWCGAGVNMVWGFGCVVVGVVAVVVSTAVLLQLG